MVCFDENNLRGLAVVSYTNLKMVYLQDNLL